MKPSGADETRSGASVATRLRPDDPDRARGASRRRATTARRRTGTSARVAAAILALAAAGALGCCALSPPRALSAPGPDCEEPTGELGERLRADLAAARGSYERAPEDESAAIWVGRRLGYLGRYTEAVEWYGARLDDFPHSYRLLRHRGHRWISVREYERAERDLARAWELAREHSDAVEPDGAPNRYGIPRSTTRSNILYHLGLARFLQGKYEAALEAYRACLALELVSDDTRVATAHWAYLTLRALGRADEARALIESLPSEPSVIENFAYLDLVRLYRGERGVRELRARYPEGIGLATVGFGVAAWLEFCGESERAQALWRTVVQGTSCSAFGRLASEQALVFGIRARAPRE